MQKPHAVIAFATDAIFSTEPLDLPVSDKLGEWSLDEFTGMTIIQPGVYFLQKEDEWQDKYRGFDKGSILREGIVNAWLNGTDYTAILTRFITLGTAVKDPLIYINRWRTWEGQAKVLNLTPRGKRRPSKDTCYWDHLCATLPEVNVLGDDVLSYPYKREWDAGYTGDPRAEFDLIEAEIKDTLN
jgi:hypothetical protein